ncbi:S24 family peptidase [Yimella sp. NH-Cas1]|uniref:S24 family peptidase n=1 Tax=Yimella sp. NH-Cas1 TaxID=2917726 RepID=UPI0023BB0746|nr:S24 family peptidase [Yimella sp. NH-Cas1]
MSLSRFKIGLAIVRGRSMLPTYQDGDRLLVLYGARPRPGRVHLVQLPPSPAGPRPLAVKRVRGETPDGWWVESDNPAEGTDSRTVGAIPSCGMVAAVIGGRPLPRRPLGRRAE